MMSGSGCSSSGGGDCETAESSTSSSASSAAGWTSFEVCCRSRSTVACPTPRIAAWSDVGGRRPQRRGEQRMIMNPGTRSSGNSARCPQGPPMSPADKAPTRMRSRDSRYGDCETAGSSTSSASSKGSFDPLDASFPPVGIASKGSFDPSDRSRLTVAVPTPRIAAWSDVGRPPPAAPH